MNRSIPALAAALAAATAIALAGCSAPSTPTESADPGELVSITVGVSPSTASAAVYAAADQEFEAANLDVTFEVIQSGAEAVPRLLNGELDLALGDGAGTITASTNGVALTVVGVATISPDDPADDYSAIIAKDPSITDSQSLEGRTVAVNQLKGGAQLTAMAAIDNQGGDSSAVQFIELPFPQMVDAVKAGSVDAALVVEPFLTAAIGGGLHVALAPQAYAVSGLPSTIFIATTAYAQANADVMARFNAAVGAAAERLNADHDLAVEVVSGYSTIDPAVLAMIVFPIFAEDAANTSGLRDVADLMGEYGFLESDPDFDTLLLAG